MQCACSVFVRVQCAENHELVFQCVQCACSVQRAVCSVCSVQCVQCAVRAVWSACACSVQRAVRAREVCMQCVQCACSVHFSLHGRRSTRPVPASLQAGGRVSPCALLKTNEQLISYDSQFMSSYHTAAAASGCRRPEFVEYFHKATPVRWVGQGGHFYKKP